MVLLWLTAGQRKLELVQAAEVRSNDPIISIEGLPFENTLASTEMSGTVTIRSTDTLRPVQDDASSLESVKSFAQAGFTFESSGLCKIIAKWFQFRKTDVK